MNANRGWAYRGRVRGAAPGEALAEYLARRYRHSNAEVWRRRIEQGSVTIDGERTHCDSRAEDGQLVLWMRPPWREPDAPEGLPVAYEDEHVVVVDKPAGLPTLPGGGFLDNTVWARVRERFPGAAPVHRLGRWTSGLLLCGRTGAVRVSLAKCWKRGEVVKTYRALASGDPLEDRFEVRVPIGPVPYAPLGSLHAATEGGKPSRTQVTVLRRCRDRFLAEAIPVTGRPHQIRIHLAAAGHPLMGDPLYATGGRPAAGCTALPGNAGYRLHATKLELRHPVTGEDLAVESDPPAGLRREGNGP